MNDDPRMTGLEPNAHGQRVSTRCPREIRVGWTEGLLWEDGSPCNGGLWRMDTPANRAQLQHAVDEGRRLFGLNTHWLEERDA